MSHTPGPWGIERVPIQSQGGSNTCFKVGPFVACIYDDWRPREEGISEAENEANARLIAAAPELLAVCKGALGYFEYMAEQSDCQFTPDKKWLVPLRAAIDLAEKGEQTR